MCDYGSVGVTGVTVDTNSTDTNSDGSVWKVEKSCPLQVGLSNRQGCMYLWINTWPVCSGTLSE